MLKSMPAMIAAMLLLAPTPAMATGVLGEYSFLHVTYNSVWHLFIFIFILVMIPFAVIIFTSWRFRGMNEDKRFGGSVGGRSVDATEKDDDPTAKSASREEQEK